MISPEVRIAGGMGSRKITGTTPVTGLNHFAITPLADTTISAITGVDEKGNSVDILASMGLTIASTLKTTDGSWICSLNYMITGITLATGAVKLD